MNIVLTTRKGHITEVKEIKNVWEIQDNGHSELVIKHHDHSCRRFKESEIDKISISLENKEVE